MIKVQNLVPEIYYNKSRDFQAIGRCFEVLYNYAKTNTDILLNVDKDIKMLDLLAKTLGFNTKHNYNTEDLIALCNTFVTILRNKGSKNSIDMAVTAMLKAQHIEKKFYVEDVVDVNNAKQYILNIYIPKELDDIILLEDLFNYILPTGYTYRFIRARFGADAYKSNMYVKTSGGNLIAVDANSMSEVGVPKTESTSKKNIERPDLNTTSTDFHSGLTYTGVVYRPIKISDM